MGTTTRFVPSQEDVTAFYDQAGPLITQLAGRNSHSGYWRDREDDSSLPAATEALTDVVIEQFGATAGQRILDVGSGLGGPAVRLAEAGANVVGVDASAVLVRDATEWSRQSSAAERVHFEQADVMQELPFSAGDFDGALVIESFVHMADRTAALREIGRVLRPGGRLVFTDFYEREPFTGERLEKIEAFQQAMLNSPFPRLEAYLPMLDAAGMYLTSYVDLTDRVHRYYQVLLGLLQQYAAGMSDEYGAAGMAALETCCRNCIETGEPRYLLMTAERF